MVPYGKATAEETQATQALESTFTSFPSFQRLIEYLFKLVPISLLYLDEQARWKSPTKTNSASTSAKPATEFTHSAYELHPTTNEATMAYSCNSSFSTVSSIRTPSRTSSIYSGPDPFLEFDGMYSIYESELEGYTTNEKSGDGKFEQVDYGDGRELGVMDMGKRLSRRERIKKWIRKVLRFS
jgi:hypothetical protein